MRWLVVLLILMTACSSTDLGGQVKTEGVPHCVDLYAHMTVSPNLPVKGVVACMTTEEANSWASIGYVTDTDFERVAQHLDLRRVHYVGRDDAGAYLLQGTTKKNTKIFLFVPVDAHGKVFNVVWLHYSPNSGG